MTKERIFTPDEIREIKEEVVDETRFRTKVLMEFKALKGIPGRVGNLEVYSKIYLALILLILGSVVGLAFSILRSGVKPI